MRKKIILFIAWCLGIQKLISTSFPELNLINERLKLKVDEQDKRIQDFKHELQVHTQSYNDRSDELIRLENQYKKLKQDFNDIIQQEEKKEVKVIYETSELKSLVIKNKTELTEQEYQENPMEPLHNLIIDLLPYLYNDVQREDGKVIVNNQLTILSNK